MTNENLALTLGWIAGFFMGIGFTVVVVMFT